MLYLCFLSVVELLDWLLVIITLPVEIFIGQQELICQSGVLTGPASLKADPLNGLEGIVGFFFTFPTLKNPEKDVRYG